MPLSAKVRQREDLRMIGPQMIPEGRRRLPPLRASGHLGLAGVALDGVVRELREVPPDFRGRRPRCHGDGRRRLRTQTGAMAATIVFVF